ncbi:type I restriction-modification system, S subunit (fragment) [Mycoplasma haemofelis str. Langford 1]|uniref:Type I restriction-modification system, S subunit n=1 Tax=Mycoplasma haemofelis (strain Langford 1) TaxID=941640 RepID=E8ZHU4_MYCHL
MFKGFLKAEVREFLLEDVCNIQNGYSFSSSKYRSTGHPIIRIGNIQGTQFKVEDLVYFERDDYKEDLSRFIIKPQDLVITARGSCGKVALNKTDSSFYLNQGVWRLDPNPLFLNREYLFYFLSNSDLSSMVIKGHIPRLNVNSI